MTDSEMVEFWTGQVAQAAGRLAKRKIFADFVGATIDPDSLPEDERVVWGRWQAQLVEQSRLAAKRSGVIYPEDMGGL